MPPTPLATSAGAAKPGGSIWNPGHQPVQRYAIPSPIRWPYPGRPLDDTPVAPIQLTPDQIQFYHDHGFIHGPHRLFSEKEMHDYIVRLYSIEEQLKAIHGGSWENRYHVPEEEGADPFYELMHEIVTHPRVLHFVKQVLGCDTLLVRNLDLVVKEPTNRSAFFWHPDTYHTLGYFKEEITTAWIAMTPSHNANGGLWFIDKSHMRPNHPDGVNEDCNKTAEEMGNPIEGVYEPGHMSCHHGRLLHASGSNMSDQRRIGIAIRYFTPRVRQDVACTGSGYLACGDAAEAKHFSLQSSFRMRWWPYRVPGPRNAGEKGIPEYQAAG